MILSRSARGFFLFFFFTHKPFNTLPLTDRRASFSCYTGTDSHFFITDRFNCRRPDMIPSVTLNNGAQIPVLGLGTWKVRHNFVYSKVHSTRCK